MELNLMRLLYEKQESNEEVALVTIISSDCLKNFSPGKMILVDRNGELLCGTFGSGILEENARKEAKVCIQAGLCRKAKINLEDTSVEIFTNSFCNKDKLIIAGGGNVPWHIYRFAKALGYSITIIDNRAEMLTKERYPEAQNLLLGDIPQVLSSLDITKDTSIVIATHHHEFDKPALKAIIESPARYIGVLGNIRREAAYIESLKSLNISEELIKKIHSPIGLDLGGRKTAEIALSVVSEIQAVKNGRLFIPITL